MARTVVTAALSVVLNASGGAADVSWDTFQLTAVALHLDRAVLRILDQNTEVQLSRLNYLVQEQALLSARASFEPKLGFAAERNQTMNAQNAEENISTGGISRGQLQVIQSQQALLASITTLNNLLTTGSAGSDGSSDSSSTTQSIPFATTPNLYRSDVNRIEIFLEGKLPTSTTYRIFGRSSELRNDTNRFSPPSLYFPEYGSSAGVTLTQPLLRDGWGAAMAPIRIAREERNIAELTYRQEIINIAGAVALHYYDLLFAFADIDVKQDAVKFARWLVQENRERANVGLLSPADVREAEVALAVAEEELVTAFAAAIERQAALKKLIFLNVNDFDSQTVLYPADPLTQLRNTWKRAEVVEFALKNRVDHQIRLHEAQKQELILKYTRNQALPKLDVAVTLAASGLDASYGDSFSRVGERQGFEYALGVQGSIPLGFGAERARLKSAEFRKLQALMNIQQSETSLSIEADTILARITANQARLDAAAQSVVQAELLIEIEKNRLAEGVGRTYDLLVARRTLNQSRSRRVAALVDYDKSIIQLQIATGTLIEFLRLPVPPPRLGAKVKSVEARTANPPAALPVVPAKATKVTVKAPEVVIKPSTPKPGASTPRSATPVPRARR